MAEEFEASRMHARNDRDWLSGIDRKTDLIHAGLEALIQREAVEPHPMPRDLPSHQYVPDFPGNTSNDPVGTHDGLVSVFGYIVTLLGSATESSEED